MSRRRLPAANAALLMGDEPLEPPVRPKRKARALKPSERQVENAIRSRLALFGIVMVKNPNEAQSAILGYGHHVLGTMLGWPDDGVYGPGRRHALFEVKVPGWQPRNAKERAHWARQLECHALLRRLGHLVAVVHSQDEAVAVLKADGWPVQ